MTQPMIKKTVTGYVIKHQCLCGEGLVNKLSQAGSIDHCPACLRQFIVPCAEEAEKLKRDLATKKAVTEEARIKTSREKAAARFHSRQKATGVLEVAQERLGRHEVDDDALRSLSDAAAHWISILAYLILAIAILCQIVLLAIPLSPFLTGFDWYWMRLLYFALYTIALQLAYYSSKVVLGMVAAGILIERNTRT